MSRISQTFQTTRREKRLAFMPFITAGDPDLDMTVDVIGELSQRGVDLIEVGFPYSDPIADGPVIQASYTRALNHKVKVEDIFAALKKATEADQPQIVWALVVLKEPQVFPTAMELYRKNHLTKVQRLGGGNAFDPTRLADLVSASDLRSDEQAASIGLQNHAGGRDHGLGPLSLFRLDQDRRTAPLDDRFLDMVQERIRCGPDRCAGLPMPSKLSSWRCHGGGRRQTTAYWVNHRGGYLHQSAIQQRQDRILREVRQISPEHR